MRVSIRFVAALALAAIAVVETAYALWFGPFVALLVAFDPTRLGWLGAVVGGVAGLVVLGLGLVLALLTGLSALGVASGHPAGWWVGMVASCLWLLTGCAPLALVAAAILLLPEVRAIAFPPPPVRAPA